MTIDIFFQIAAHDHREFVQLQKIIVNEFILFQIQHFFQIASTIARKCVYSFYGICPAYTLTCIGFSGPEIVILASKHIHAYWHAACGLVYTRIYLG